MSRQTAATGDTFLKTIVIVVAAVLLVPIFAMVFMMPIAGGGHMWYVNGAEMPGGLWPWLLSWLVVLLIAVGVVYVLYRGVTSTGGEEDAALEELRLAYARGDLTDEEFENRRKRLERER